MESVVFLRGANAIGSRVFSPMRLASELAELNIVNIGAAGTFVVRASCSPSVINARFEEALPHDADIIVRTPAEIRALLADGKPAALDGARTVVSVLASRPIATARLPIEKGEPWMVRVERMEGYFTIGQKRAVGGRWMDANAVVERALGVRATTRVWETFERITRLLNE